MSQKPYFPYIQLLRGLAACSVVAFHALGANETYLSSRSGLFEVFRNGDAGVDLFFVISGFVITWTCYERKVGPLTFTIRRLERIVPLYYMANILMLTLAIAAPSLFKNLNWFNFGYIFRSFTFLSFVRDGMPMVFVGWSLEFELIFYLLVAMCLIFTQNPWHFICMILSFAVLLGKIYPESSRVFSYVFTDGRLLEFSLGVLIALFAFDRSNVRGAATCVGLGVVVTAWTNPSDRVITFGLPAAILVAIAVYITVNGIKNTLFTQKANIVGDASYAIYLCQVFTIPAVARICSKLLPPSAINLAILTGVVTTVLAGILIHVTVERPLGKYLRR